MASFVYVLLNRASTPPTYYVGKSNDPDKRLVQHKAAALSKRNRFRHSHLYSAFRKYGGDSFEILERFEYPSEELAFQGETFHIARLRALNRPLYNKSGGGYGGQTKQDSEATRQKKSASAKVLNLQESVRQRKSAALQGHVKSLETRQKLSLAKKQPVVQYDRHGALVARHPSALDAEVHTGVARSHISQSCKGKRPHAGGFVWRYGELT